MNSLTFLIMFLVLMALVSIIPQLLKRLYIPSVIGMLLVGMLIGPNSLDLLRMLNHLMGRGIPTDQLYTIIEFIGYLGLIFLMTLAGLEVNLEVLFAEKKAVGLLSLLTFLIPACAGFGVYHFFRPYDLIGKLFYASLFASHSVGIVFPIIKELNIAKTRFGVAVLASTVITDLLSLILLAICVQLKRHAISDVIFNSISIFDKINPNIFGYPLFFLFFFAAIASYIFLVMWSVPIISRVIFKKLHPTDDLRVSFFLCAVLFAVFIGEVIGVNIIVGAFLAGMALYRCEEFHHHNQILQQKIEGIGYGLLIPFLFLGIGMNTNIGILFEKSENLLLTLFTVVGLIASKVSSGWLALRLAGFSQKKAICAGLMTVPQLSATLAAAAVGLALNIISPEFFNAVIILSLFTTIPVPILVKLLIVKGGITFDQIEDRLHVQVETEEVEESYI